MKTDTLNIAELKMTYSTKVKPSDRLKIDSPNTAYEILIQLYDPEQIEYKETLIALFLNSSNQIIGALEIGSGGINSCTMDVRHLLQPAILSNCVGVILAHNHPSGKCLPSEADIKLTEQCFYALGVFDINLMDHIIVTKDNGFYSFSEKGDLPRKRKLF